MRNIIRSPFFVAIMVLVAIWIVYTDIVKPLNKKGLLSAPSAMIQAIKNKAQHKTSLQSKALAWSNQDVSRSPFSAPESKSKRTNHASRHQTDRYRLSAILFGIDKPLALINGKTVAEGEKIGKYIVLSIQENHVTLQGSKGQYKLALTR